MIPYTNGGSFYETDTLGDYLGDDPDVPVGHPQTVVVCAFHLSRLADIGFVDGARAGIRTRVSGYPNHLFREVKGDGAEIFAQKKKARGTRGGPRATLRVARLF